MLIGLAGPGANFVLAFVLMVFYFGWINEVPSVQVKTTTIGVGHSRLGRRAGRTSNLATSSRALTPPTIPIGKRSTNSVKLNAGQPVPVTVDRGGKPSQSHSARACRGQERRLRPERCGHAAAVSARPHRRPGSDAGNSRRQAGLRAGDAIQSVDGHPFHTVDTLLAYMQAGQGKPISLVVLRNGATLHDGGSSRQARCTG